MSTFIWVNLLSGTEIGWMGVAGLRAASMRGRFGHITQQLLSLDINVLELQQCCGGCLLCGRAEQLVLPMMA